MPIMDEAEIDACYERYLRSGGDAGESEPPPAHASWRTYCGLGITVAVSTGAWYGLVKLALWLMAWLR